MSKMYNVARYIPMNHPYFPGNLNGEEKYHGLEKAKIAMRETVVEKFAGGLEKLTKKIDEYCGIYYPDNIPTEFVKLKGLIMDVLSDPTFPKSQETLEEKYGWFDFEDERIHFWFEEEYVNFIEGTGDKVPTLQIEINDEDEEIFLQGFVSCFIMKDLPDDDDLTTYRCWLSAGVNVGLDIDLSIVLDDEF